MTKIYIVKLEKILTIDDEDAEVLRDSLEPSEPCYYYIDEDRLAELPETLPEEIRKTLYEAVKKEGCAEIFVGE